jgi:hypothetical protein
MTGDRTVDRRRRSLFGPKNWKEGTDKGLVWPLRGYKGLGVKQKSPAGCYPHGIIRNFWRVQLFGADDSGASGELRYLNRPWTRAQAGLSLRYQDAGSVFPGHWAARSARLDHSQVYMAAAAYPFVACFRLKFLHMGITPTRTEGSLHAAAGPVRRPLRPKPRAWIAVAISRS